MLLGYYWARFKKQHENLNFRILNLSSNTHIHRMHCVVEENVRTKKLILSSPVVSKPGEGGNKDARFIQVSEKSSSRENFIL